MNDFSDIGSSLDGGDFGSDGADFAATAEFDAAEPGLDATYDNAPADSDVALDAADLEIAEAPEVDPALESSDDASFDAADELTPIEAPPEQELDLTDDLDAAARDVAPETTETLEPTEDAIDLTADMDSAGPNQETTDANAMAEAPLEEAQINLAQPAETETRYTDAHHEKGAVLEEGYQHYLEGRDNVVALAPHDSVTTPGFDGVYFDKESGRVTVVEDKNLGSEARPGYVSEVSAWREDHWNNNVTATLEQIEQSDLSDDTKDQMTAALLNGDVDRELVIGTDTRVSEARLEENQVGRLVQFDPAAGAPLRVEEVVKGK